MRSEDAIIPRSTSTGWSAQYVTDRFARKHGCHVMVEEWIGMQAEVAGR
jgi:hypothetical protein